MVFKNENALFGLPVKVAFQVGASDVDSGPPAETGAFIPIASDPEATWVYYDVALACTLDSGIVVHRRLPSVNNEADTLASCNIEDKDIDKLTGRGVNLLSHDSFADVVQRMAHSQYWFHLHGQAMRIGFQIPIPRVRKVGGAEAVPHDANPQRAYNKIVGNYSGVVLWYAQWSLWYTLAKPPTKQDAPPQNLAQHIAGDAESPKDGMQAPWTRPDDNAVASASIRQPG